MHVGIGLCAGVPGRGSAGNLQTLPGALVWSTKMIMPPVLREFFEFLLTNKKWWLAPTLIVLLILAGLMIFAHGTALAPFMYSH